MVDVRVFWANVFTVLEHQGRSVEYLAQRLGVSRATLYRWRDGSRVAPPEQREAAANVLGVPVTLLFLPQESPAGDESTPDGAILADTQERIPA